jgi:hypothetical protein
MRVVAADPEQVEGLAVYLEGRHELAGCEMEQLGNC